MSNVKDLVESIAASDAQSGEGLGRLVNDIARQFKVDRGFSPAKESFDFKLTIGCIYAVRETVSIDSWDIESEDWAEMDDKERSDVIEDHLGMWKSAWLEANLEDWLKNNADADYA